MEILKRYSVVDREREPRHRSRPYIGYGKCERLATDEPEGS